MNALNVLCLLVAAANAQLIPGLLPYTHNFLHTNAFRTVAGVPAPLKYTVNTPVKYTVAAPAPVKYTFAAAPVPVAAPAPVAYTTAAVAPAVVAPNTRTSQFHAQDELGQFNFGYSGGPSSRHETKDAFGVVRGSYNYVDANGVVQTQSYIADANGFRVAATNLPVAPKAADAPALVGPEPVMDTAEVAEAKATFKKLFDEAAAAAAAAPDTRRKRSAPLVAPEPVQDTAEVAAAKAEFQALFDKAAAAAEAAPDVGPLEGPFHPITYGAYAPFRYNGYTPFTGLNHFTGLTPYSGLPFNHGVLPFTTGALAFPHNAYPYNFAISAQ